MMSPDRYHGLHGHECPDRLIPVVQPRCYAFMLHSEKDSATPRAAHDPVGDEQHTVAVADLPDAGEVAGRNEAMRMSVLARIPLGRIGETADIVGPVLFLCSPEADGGWLL